MQSQSDASSVADAQPPQSIPSEPARKAWDVKLEEIRPKATLSDRLKAREAMMRSALGCGTY